MIKRVASAVQRRLVRDGSADAGFSLIEVLVSFVLFATVASAATYGIVNALQTSHNGQERVDAANIAQSFIAQTQTNTSSVQTETARQVATSSLGSDTFTVLRWITFTTPGATQCSPGQTFTVSVTVSLQASGKFLARSDSVVAC